MDKEKNRIALETIFLHLSEALRLCTHLDFSELGPLEQTEWSERIKLCKNAIEFTKDSVEKLSVLIA